MTFNFLLMHCNHLKYLSRLACPSACLRFRDSLHSFRVRPAENTTQHNTIVFNMLSSHLFLQFAVLLPLLFFSFFIFFFFHSFHLIRFACYKIICIQRKDALCDNRALMQESKKQRKKKWQLYTE